MKKINFFVLLFTCAFQFGNAQVITSNDSTLLKKENIKFNYKQLIIPTALITYGVLGLTNSEIKKLDVSIRDQVVNDNHSALTIDNYTQFLPAVSVYALNLAGIEGKNNFKDRTIILATSTLIMGTTVFALKKTSKIERPDFSANTSFPSGHTANAFAGAEFLWQEYKNKSIWIGISGYIIASGTGVLRIYNNKHWLNDVAMGAGIGILSTKIAYWAFPYLNNKIFKSNKNASSTMVLPFYNGNQMGVGMIMNLK
jgi:membrane-associated phospholipid phosphatase